MHPQQRCILSPLPAQVFFFFNQLQVIRASHTSNVKTDIIKSCSQRPKGNENMDGEHLNMVFKKYNQKEEAHHLLAQLI